MTHRGFTLIELLVVLAIIATLLTVVSPNYFRHLDRAKEAVLRQNLTETRDAIDKFNGDKGRYPTDLAQLVSEHYLKRLPADPITDRTDSWQLIPPPDGSQGLYDIKSGATGHASDGAAFHDW